MDEQINIACIDESVGRRMARLHGLKLTGSLGILMKAKREGYDIDISHAIERMQNQGIRLSDSLIQAVLKAL